MKEIFTEEEYNEAVKKYNEKIKIDFYSNVSNYSTYEGYADLRKYNLSENDFKLLWRCQDLLFNFDFLNDGTSSIYSEIKSVYLNYFRGM